MLTAIEVYETKPQQLAARCYPLHMLNTVLNEETGKMMEYQQIQSKEVGRLAQGLPDEVKGTYTITFIFKDQVPEDKWKNVTYARACANYRPEKDIHQDTNHIRKRQNQLCRTPTVDSVGEQGQESS